MPRPPLKLRRFVLSFSRVVMMKGVDVRAAAVAGVLGLVAATLPACVSQERPPTGPAPGRPEEATVRPLPADLGPDPMERPLARRWEGHNFLVEAKSPDEVRGLVGEEAAEGLVQELVRGVDFARERVVFVMRLTSEGQFRHEIQEAAGGPRVVFYVRGPAGRGPRSEIALWGLHFFAVEKAASVAVEQGERG